MRQGQRQRETMWECVALYAYVYVFVLVQCAVIVVVGSIIIFPNNTLVCYVDYKLCFCFAYELLSNVSCKCLCIV